MQKGLLRPSAFCSPLSRGPWMGRDWAQDQVVAEFGARLGHEHSDKISWVSGSAPRSLKWTRIQVQNLSVFRVQRVAYLCQARAQLCNQAFAPDLRPANDREYCIHFFLKIEGKIITHWLRIGTPTKSVWRTLWVKQKTDVLPFSECLRSFHGMAVSWGW